MKIISIITIYCCYYFIITVQCWRVNPGPRPCTARDLSLNYTPALSLTALKFKNNIYSNTASLLCLW